MFRNYFLTAIAVLKRRKFFSFISLFGISFTLTILIVLAAFVDYLVRPGYPDLKRDRCLYIFSVQEKNSKTGDVYKAAPSFYFLDHYAGSLKIPEKVGISSLFSPISTYISNRKFVLNVKYCNMDYWVVMDYAFLEGRPFSRQQLQNGDKVAVISEATKANYFGDKSSATGRYIRMGNEEYRVTGVIKNVPVTMLYSAADVILPYTLSKTDYHDRSVFGGYTAILLAHSTNELQQIKDEYNSMVLKIPVAGNKNDRIFSHADSYVESVTRPIFGEKNDFESTGLSVVMAAMAILIFVFMLLPAINLVNINISRIMERSSEIGVRKAFGASSMTLVYQFIIENLILTLIGGVISLVLSFIILSVINGSGIIPEAHLGINVLEMLFCFISCLIFGLLSGVYPAWRMSRVQIVQALKAK